MHQNVATLGAYSFSCSDLPRPFRHRYQHNIDYPDTTNYERYCCYASQKVCETAPGIFQCSQKFRLIVYIEIRFLTGRQLVLTPEKLFEKRWAMTVLERVFGRLGTEFATAGKSRQFEELGTYLTGDQPRIPYKQAAEKLGMSEGAVKAGVYRMRRRFGEVLQEEIADTVTSQDQVEGEIRHLLAGMA